MKPPIVLDRLGTFGFVHHQALNDFANLDRALKLVQAWPDVVHILEADLCWNFRSGREDLYFRHPRFVFDSLSARKIDRLVAARMLVTIDDMWTLVDSNVFVIIELKVGRGDREAAIRKLLDFLEHHLAGRYWIDGFSLSLLRQVRSLMPATPITLHTELVRGGRALLLSPQWPMIGLKKVSEIDDVDAIAIRWHGSERVMRRSARAVTSIGQRLILSRLHTPKRFELSRRWGAIAGYVYGDFTELMVLHRRLDEEQEVPR